LKFAQSGSVDNANAVNKESDTSKLHKMSIRHLDKVGILAHSFKVFAKHEWNVQELENIVFKEREACVVSIRFTGDLTNVEAAIAEIKENQNVLSVTL
jgi:D-3-phosphoglycerate dehydrogenase